MHEYMHFYKVITLILIIQIKTRVNDSMHSSWIWTNSLALTV